MFDLFMSIYVYQFMSIYVYQSKLEINK